MRFLGFLNAVWVLMCDNDWWFSKLGTISLMIYLLNFKLITHSLSNVPTTDTKLTKTWNMVLLSWCSRVNNHSTCLKPFSSYFHNVNVSVEVIWWAWLVTLQGQTQAISVEGLHQLHIFIFVLACVHVFYSCFTVLVGLWQVRHKILKVSTIVVGVHYVQNLQKVWIPYICVSKSK